MIKAGLNIQMAENILGALGEVGFREIGVKERPGTCGPQTNQDAGSFNRNRIYQF